MTRRKGRPIVDISREDVEAMLKRAESLLPSKDVDLLKGIVGTLEELLMRIWSRRATIAGLRQLVGPPVGDKPSEVPETAAQSEVDAAASSADGSGSQPAGDDKGVGAAADSSEAAAGAKPADGAEKEPEKKKAKGHGRVPASAYRAATHIPVPHTTLRAGEGCPDCARGKLYPLDDTPIVRIFGQAPLHAICWDCEELRCGACGKVYTAHAPEEAQGPKYSESAVSMIALLTYGTGMPYFRMDRFQRNLETPVPASTQWQVAAEGIPSVRPAFDELLQRAAQGQVLHNDDSHAVILEYAGKRGAKLREKGLLVDPERTGLSTTGIVSITEAGPIALFFTGRQHAGENLDDVLSRRDPKLSPPIQMGDALTRNVPKEREVIESNCLAHGLRKIADEIDNEPKECRDVLRRMSDVYDVDERCKTEKMSDRERLITHQRESAPVMEEIRQAMQKALDQKRIEPNSGLGEAFRYLLKRWEKLTVFLRVPGAPLDNNICERALKMAIKHRNASLFYRNARGAKVGDIYMSLIHTAELHGANPFDYLTALQRHSKAVADKPSEWLPWNYKVALARAEAKRPPTPATAARSPPPGTLTQAVAA
jgi:transposase